MGHVEKVKVGRGGMLLSIEQFEQNATHDHSQRCFEAKNKNVIGISLNFLSSDRILSLVGMLIIKLQWFCLSCFFLVCP